MPFEASLDLDLDDVIDGFRTMQRRSRNLAPVWRENEARVKRDQSEHSRLEEGSDARWQPLAASTITARAAARSRGKKYPARKPLKRKGPGLSRAVAIRFDARRLRIESKVPWSGVHQDGGVAGRGQVIPKREHVYFSGQLLDRITDDISKYIAGGF